VYVTLHPLHSNLYVNLSTISAGEVKELFLKFGLKCTEPEHSNDNKKARVLGVDVNKVNGISR